jgi:hypothetical protein
MNLVDTETGEIVGQIQDQEWTKARLDEIADPFEGERPDMTLALLDGNFRFMPRGLKITGDPTFADWMACGHSLKKIKQGLHFAIGDWLIYGQNKWPNRYDQGMAIFGFAYSTLATDKWIAEKIPISRRREVPFGYHRAVGGLEPAQQDEILDKAEKEKWDRETIRGEVRKIRNPTPQNRARRIKEVRVSCDLLYGEWDGKTAVEFNHTDGGSRTYCPGWKILYKLVGVIRSTGWHCEPLDTYGMVGWIARRR